MSAYTDFLEDPGRIEVWIADLKPYDPDLAAEVTVRVATDEYATEPTDSPANTPYDDAPLAEPPNFETDATPPGTLGQLPALRGGELKLGLRFGDRDAWRSYEWGGRNVTVRHGGYSPRLGRKLTFAEMGVFEYEMERAKFGLDAITIPLRDPARRFEDELQAGRYMGTDFSLHLGTNTYVSFGAVGGAAGKCNLTGDLTIEVRFWLNAFAASNTTVFFWDNSSRPFQLTIESATGKIFFTATGYAAALKTNYVFSLKRWYSLQVTRAGTAITFRILEKSTGTETIETFTASAATGASANGSLSFGYATNFEFPGIFDELRLWNYARTAEEWRQQRGRELTSTEAAVSSLKLYCRANDASGTTVADSSGSPANGTITGATSTWLPSLQGKADLAGRVLPDGFGFVEDATPVLVYEPTQIYQIHSRNISGNIVASEGGATITLNTAYTDWLAFLLASVSDDGKYDSLICTDGTFIRYRSKLTKPPSVTFDGDATGSGYVSTAADITRRIITTRGQNPFADPGDLNTASYTALNTANSSVVGRYYTAPVTIAQAVKDLLGSVGAVGWFGMADRKHRVKRFESASSGTPVLTLTEATIISIEPVDAEQPVWQEILSYRHNYTPMSVDQMASSIVTTVRQAFLAAPVRLTPPRTNTATLDRNKYARSEQAETYLTTEADAVVEGDRRLALFSQTPRGYRVEASAPALQLDRMDVVALDYKDLDAAGAEQNRLGLDGTSDAYFRILACGVRAAEGKITLTIWRES